MIVWLCAEYGMRSADAPGFDTEAEAIAAADVLARAGKVAVGGLWKSMSELSTFRDHARRMAEPRSHKPPCPGWVETDEITRWGVRRRASCPGCVPDADRALWRRLADEVDAYLSHDEEAGLFA